MKQDGYDVPAWVETMLANGRESFYEGGVGQRNYWNPESKSQSAEKLSPRFRHLPTSIDHPSLVAKNHGARLWDIGDGVACVEFKTKMNAVDADITSMLVKAVELGQKDFDAVVIANHADAAFSAGANLMMIMMGAQAKQWDALRNEISSFQKAVKGLREASIPVVAAPFGLTLGGGAEICLGASALQAHAELYMGLVEVGVGLIPGGGGCFSLLHNLQAKGPDIDPMVYLKEAFLTIAMAKVGTSAKESCALGFLNPADRITMDRDDLIEAAKWHALGLARSDYQPSRNRKIKVAGTTGFGTLAATLWDMEQSNQISAHDRKIALGLAKILSGGDVAMGTVVSEDRFHELEQEVFLSLCGEEKTMQRIQYMLTNNKPLRN
jgi:3-hydroxyacyl-CoA dehydrogenase